MTKLSKFIFKSILGGIVKNSKNSSSTEFKQWITLFGEEAERKLAKVDNIYSINFYLFNNFKIK